MNLFTFEEIVFFFFFFSLAVVISLLSFCSQILKIVSGIHCSASSKCWDAENFIHGSNLAHQLQTVYYFQTFVPVNSRFNQYLVETYLFFLLSKQLLPKKEIRVGIFSIKEYKAILASVICNFELVLLNSFSGEGRKMFWSKTGQEKQCISAWLLQINVIENTAKTLLWPHHDRPECAGCLRKAGRFCQARKGVSGFVQVQMLMFRQRQ